MLFMKLLLTYWESVDKFDSSQTLRILLKPIERAFTRIGVERGSIGSSIKDPLVKWPLNKYILVTVTV